MLTKNCKNHLLIMQLPTYSQAEIYDLNSQWINGKRTLYLLSWCERHWERPYHRHCLRGPYFVSPIVWFFSLGFHLFFIYMIYFLIFYILSLEYVNNLNNCLPVWYKMFIFVCLCVFNINLLLYIHCMYKGEINLFLKKERFT